MNFYAIDFGHTNYKIAFFKNGNLSSTCIYSYSKKSITDNLCNEIKKEKFEKILCCNVLNDKIINSIVKKLPDEIQSHLKFFKSNDCLEYIDLSYKKNIDRLGSDRAINLVSASQKTNKDVIVIDSGTATTIDYLDSNKVHCGGIILPSSTTINNFFNEMLDFNFNEENFSKSVFSNNTRSCIESGSIFSAYTVINNVIDVMKKTKASDPDIFVTGGNAMHVIDNCNYSTIHVESLLFDGLMVLGS